MRYISHSRNPRIFCFAGKNYQPIFFHLSHNDVFHYFYRGFSLGALVVGLCCEKNWTDAQDEQADSDHTAPGCPDPSLPMLQWHDRGHTTGNCTAVPSQQSSDSMKNV